MKIAKSKGRCWVWPYAINRRGYASLYYQGKLHRAHRVIFEVIKGRIPVDCVVDHICNNPSCVNPEHLQAIPQRHNVRRGLSCKMTVPKVVKLIKLYSKMTQKELGKKFGISQSAVTDILYGKTWKIKD